MHCVKLGRKQPVGKLRRFSQLNALLLLLLWVLLHRAVRVLSCLSPILEKIPAEQKSSKEYCILMYLYINL